MTLYPPRTDSYPEIPIHLRLMSRLAGPRLSRWGLSQRQV